MSSQKTEITIVFQSSKMWFLKKSLDLLENYRKQRKELYFNLICSKRLLAVLQKNINLPTIQNLNNKIQLSLTSDPRKVN